MLIQGKSLGLGLLIGAGSMRLCDKLSMGPGSDKKRHKQTSRRIQTDLPSEQKSVDSGAALSRNKNNSKMLSVSNNKSALSVKKEELKYLKPDSALSVKKEESKHSKPDEVSLTKIEYPTILDKPALPPVRFSINSNKVEVEETPLNKPNYVMNYNDYGTEPRSRSITSSWRNNDAPYTRSRSKGPERSSQIMEPERVGRKKKKHIPMSQYGVPCPESYRPPCKR